MTGRYAIYYAPARDHQLTALAGAWLGYDAWTGAAVPRPAVAGLAMTGDEVAALIQDPQHYGFHATLKAPFVLADTRSEAELIGAFHDFAARQPAFAADLMVGSLSGFTALILAQPSPAMTALHTACVQQFDAFRAPLTTADLERRRRAPLTAEQDARLLAWGYPYIFDDFRFHMTLTGRIADPSRRGAVAAALAGYFAGVTGRHLVDTLCLFHQGTRSQPFRILAAAPLAGAAQPA